MTEPHVEQLWASLIDPPLGFRSRGNEHEALALLHEHHGAGEAEAATTALLICTDWRRRRYAARTVKAVLGSPLLSEADLNAIAEIGLWEPALQVELINSAGRAVAPISRPIPDALRRWAASRILRTDPGQWEAVWQRISTLDARAGAAVVLGVLDAIGFLPPDLAEESVERASTWPSAAIRRSAQRLRTPSPSAGDSEPTTLF